MKKILLILFFFPLISLHAQDVKTRQSASFEVRDGDDFLKIGTGFYKMEIDNAVEPRFSITAKLMKSAHSITLYKYGNAMNEIKKNELENGKKNFEPFLPKMFNFDSKLFLVYYKFYKAEDTARLFISQIDPETLELINTKVLFGFSQKKASAFKAFAYEEDDYHLFVSLSPDKNKVLIAHANKAQISSCVMDKNTNITENTSSKCPDLKNFVTLKAFIDNNGNKYISYKGELKGDVRNGVFVQNVSGKENFSILTTGDPTYNANHLDFINSKDNTKIYVYGAYSIDRFYEDEGVLLSTIDAENVKINTPQLFPFSDDFRQKMYDFNFADKHKGLYCPAHTEFSLKELENGSLVLIGSPTETVGPNFINYQGPIVSLLINNGKINYTIIPRMLLGVSPCLFVSNKNNIVCIYADFEKNLALDINSIKLGYQLAYLPQNLVLTAAIIDGNNTIVSRKKIADKQDKNYCFLDESDQLTDNSFIIPFGHAQANLAHAYDVVTQWLDLEIE